MSKWVLVAILATATLISACDTGQKSGWGFTLPEGDAKQGEALFLSLQCNSCHVVVGKEHLQQPENPPLSIRLGGKVRRIQTYGELVTSIINPSHKLARGYPTAMIADDGQSKMKYYNDVMTVEQLTHLVTFLQEQYELQEYSATTYGYYP